jgi:tRNA nucleotidyltransferase (CCA-adding enzyme)
VGPGSLEQDLRRRDFSINALAIPLSEDAGDQVQIIDVADGVGDLEARRLRILHGRSFHDDPTRALRAARLAGRLGFSLSRETRNALRDAQRDGAFGPVSGDRLRREIAKCFSDAALGLDPAVALRLLSDWHVLPTLEPGLSLPREAVVPIRRLGRMLEEPLWRTGRQRPWVSGLALWLAPLDGGLRRRTLSRFSVRGDAGKRITAFADSLAGRLEVLSGTRGRGAIDALLAEIDEETLHALHASAAPTLRRRITRWAVEDRTRRLPVSGNDLLDLGLSGSGVGEVLSRLRSAFLDGEVANREEAIALAQELVRSRRQRPRRAAAKAGRGGRSARKSAAGKRPGKQTRPKKPKPPKKKGAAVPRDVG